MRRAVGIRGTRSPRVLCIPHRLRTPEKSQWSFSCHSWQINQMKGPKELTEDFLKQKQSVLQLVLLSNAVKRPEKCSGLSDAVLTLSISGHCQALSLDPSQDNQAGIQERGESITAFTGLPTHTFTLAGCALSIGPRRRQPHTHTTKARSSPQTCRRASFSDQDHFSKSALSMDLSPQPQRPLAHLSALLHYEQICPRS